MVIHLAVKSLHICDLDSGASSPYQFQSEGKKSFKWTRNNKCLYVLGQQLICYGYKHFRTIRNTKHKRPATFDHWYICRSLPSREKTIRKVPRDESEKKMQPIIRETIIHELPNAHQEAAIA
ncbi:hypothetical protein PDIP_52680 [Penicillium digitatum Pd1]|uniref:Uncharacterized protein n=1 Tax=Penicillium digitatum (strain Pd1 / CECT 20795) TaxID=1170230 RepID=K9GC28_PEND1|nr:hypothetical protein PDIP_52680 [Penicillium digitatum Pd1]EKV12378.1 hypothetical protein PDIP_52680 [Penicillium digitatum Pd1]